MPAEDQENNVLTIVPSKTDKDKAQELKSRLSTAMAPVLELCDEIHEEGFTANVGWGIGPLGKNVLTVLNLTKVY